MRKRAVSVASSPGVRVPSSPLIRLATISCSFSSSARRTASVGCAVKTGSTSMRGSQPASSSRETPCALRRASASCSPSGCGRALPARW